jgi:predicted  nucleic acid-binding Zn-ribbon protein
MRVAPGAPQSGGYVDRQLETLIELQQYDSKIARLEGEMPRLQKQIETIQEAVAQAKKTSEALKLKVDATRKELRSKEKDLDVIAGKRSKQEGRLYEVKTNKEYSAVLLEIEEIKQEKAKTEEEILALMELGERLAVDVRDSEKQLATREEQGRATRPPCATACAPSRPTSSACAGSETPGPRICPATCSRTTSAF